MKAFLEIFKLEFLGLVRSRALTLLVCATVAWMFAAPHIFRADGTAEGAREMCVRFSLGGVATLLAVSLLIAAAGSFAREREARRLQLTMVRPVRLVVLAIGKICALSVAGALILALAATIEALRQDSSRTCYSVFRPILPSPAKEAESMYAAYMADPETPAAVKQARKSVVLRLLTQRALDHYQTINTNETATWNFLAPALSDSYAVRLRFTNMYEMRDEVRGRISMGDYDAIVSNITQAIVKIPLTRRSAASSRHSSPGNLSFSNQGNRAVMLRPRRDVELLTEADGFCENLVRAYLQLVGMLILLVSFGVFLGAGLSRPVAIFVAIVTLALSEMSPSVIEQYPDELETNRVDAIGLTLARFSAAATHPIGSLHPLASLAADERVEPADVFRIILTDVFVLPILLAFLSALILPRKQGV